jgi:hypothetical protein
MVRRLLLGGLDPGLLELVEHGDADGAGDHPHDHHHDHDLDEGHAALRGAAARREASSGVAGFFITHLRRSRRRGHSIVPGRGSLGAPGSERRPRRGASPPGRSARQRVAPAVGAQLGEVAPGAPADLRRAARARDAVGQRPWSARKVSDRALTLRWPRAWPGCGAAGRRHRAEHQPARRHDRRRAAAPARVAAPCAQAGRRRALPVEHHLPLARAPLALAEARRSLRELVELQQGHQDRERDAPEIRPSPRS